MEHAVFTGVLLLGANALSGSLPPSWSSLTSLKVLDLSFNELSSVLPRGWTALRSRVALYLAFNHFSGTLVPSWSEGPFLQLVELQGNAVTGGFAETVESADVFAAASSFRQHTLWRTTAFLGCVDAIPEGASSYRQPALRVCSRVVRQFARALDRG